MALEVTGKEPAVGLHRQGGGDLPLAVRAAVLRNLGDPIEHQHRRKRKLRIARSEEFAAPAGEKGFVIKTGTAIRNRDKVLYPPARIQPQKNCGPRKRASLIIWD